MDKRDVTVCELLKINDIRAYAEWGYNKGWDYVVECFSDGDILEALSENGMSVIATIKSLQETIDLRKQQMEEHQAEARSSY
jgi:hypothetical protein